MIGIEETRIEVALQYRALPYPGPSFLRCDVPVQANHLAIEVSNVFEGKPGPFGKYGHWYFGDCVTNFADVTRRKFLVLRRAKDTRPGIKQLDQISPIGNFALEVGNGGIGDALQQ